MRHFALLGLVGGGIIVAGLVYSIVEGRSIPLSAAPLAILGVAILAVSIRILLPSYAQSMQRRLSRLEGMLQDQRDGYMRTMLFKQAIVLFVALIIELPTAWLTWSLVELRPYIAAVVGVTMLFLLLVVGLIVHRRRRT
jgi:uncharacterized protein YacL